MKTVKKVQTLKGFRDFLPEEMNLRNRVISIFRNVFEKYGFAELQTPSLEYQEVLLGKYGEEAEKLMYTFEDKGGRKVGLKYDLTVPLARVSATYPNLTKPFKRYQIQPVWRGDKPQKGRYREIYMCDVDTIGSISPLADAEILAVISDILVALKFKEFNIRINSRQVLFDIMKKAGVPKEKWFSAIQSIDKLDKKSRDSVKKELAQKGLSIAVIKTTFEGISKAKPDEFLNKTKEYAEKLGATNVNFDPTLARGLDYYTGPIFETVVTKPKIGSITGGGRYDKLLKTIGGPDQPAVGTTIGLDRIIDVIEDLGLWKDTAKTNTKVLVTILSSVGLERSLATAQLLRRARINCELYPDPSAKLAKQLRYADKKGIPFAIMIGPKEITKGEVVLKDMGNKTQKSITKEALLTKLSR